jgi:hypothetical protein
VIGSVLSRLFAAVTEAAIRPKSRIENSLPVKLLSNGLTGSAEF